MSDFFTFFGMGILLLTLAIILHEAGHILAFRILFKKKVSVKFYYKSISNIGFETGSNQDYEDLPADKKYLIYVWGVFAGLLVVIPAAFIHTIFWVLMPLYFFGSASDIKLIMENIPKDFMEDEKT